MYTIEYNESAGLSEHATEPATDNTQITRRITRYLRWVGSILIVLSAISFMLQGHADLLPAYRYWIGLGFTLLLCCGGFICAYLFKETKGARIFFGLGAAFLPVQVSQVSAMIYAYWHGQAALQPAYNWLRFIDVSPAIIGLDFLITAGLLVAVNYAGFAMLARKHLPTLLWTSVTANALLLLPVRDGTLIACIIAGLFMLLRYSEQRLHHDSSMRLAEGLAARALMSLPLWIIIGRSLLHPTSYLLAMVLSAIVVAYCILDIKRYTQAGFILYSCQWIGTLAAIGIWLIVLEQFKLFSERNFGVFLPIALILFALSGHVKYHARFYRFIASLLIVGLTFGAMLNQQALAPILTIAAGLFLSVAGLQYREKAPFFSGNLCVAGGFLFYWDYAVNLYASTPWISSIVLGLSVILLASYLESKDKLIMAKTRYYFSQLKNWN
ncbi:hypothetical protein [Methylomonas methanica]|uniref:DUF2157 domain-containing protein n=1 Tax=Methylomonas methanica (strain DSM 25384 / MC09) TaxID=857087 RepID=F9ZX90_METMM|nr:hypothetical protein [Methylomonas methanica]AEF99700.1 hypothetical protein Metme_1274 [Methylomonas methanica MC09]